MEWLCLHYNRDYNYCDDMGWTLLHYAAYYGFIKLTDRLLQGGADVLVRNDDGFSALDLARARRWNRIAALIERRQAAKLNAQKWRCQIQSAIQQQ